MLKDIFSRSKLKFTRQFDQMDCGAACLAMVCKHYDIDITLGKLREARTRQNAIQSRLESAQNRVRMREMYAGSKVDEAFSRFDVLELAGRRGRVC